MRAWEAVLVIITAFTVAFLVTLGCIDAARVEPYQMPEPYEVPIIREASSPEWLSTHPD